jgi:hypothetical protein
MGDLLGKSDSGEPKADNITSSGYGDGDVLICIFPSPMTTTRFKAVMVMIPSELCS